MTGSGLISRVFFLSMQSDVRKTIDYLPRSLLELLRSTDLCDFVDEWWPISVFDIVLTALLLIEI